MMTPRHRRIALQNRALLQSERLLKRKVSGSYRRLAKLLRDQYYSGSIVIMEEWINEWAINDLAFVLRQYGLRIGISFGEFIYDQPAFKSALSFETKNFRSTFADTLRAWISQHSLRRANNISKGLIAQIRKRILTGQSEGLGEAAIARSLSKFIRKPYHAARIARTESHTASEVGTREAVKSTGLDTVKEWASTEDSRTRPNHARADGQIKNIDEPFNVGDQFLQHPGDPLGSAKEVINCRCVALYHPRVNGEIIR